MTGSGQKDGQFARAFARSRQSALILQARAAGRARAASGRGTYNGSAFRSRGDLLEVTTLERADSTTRAGAWRHRLANLGLLLGSLTVTYVLIEWMLFTLFLHALPLGVHGSLPPDIQPLAQSSKRATVPRDYVALVGDSYAAGYGDWHEAQSRLTNAPFHSAHLIHAATGRDVVTFGQGGAGSFDGIVYYPLAAYAHLRASRFDVEPPRDVLVYFYEGNDLDNNLVTLRRHYMDRFDVERIYEPEYFDDFMRQLVEPETARIEAAHGRLSELYFARTVTSAIMGRFRKEPDRPKRKKIDTETRLRVGAEEVKVPLALQGPAMELNEEETRLAVYVLERSLAYLARAWPAASLHVIYIPSPLSSYPILSETVRVQTYHDRRDTFPAAAIPPRSRELCGMVADAARRSGVSFLDASGYIWDLASRQTAHGPLDWKHLNREGQEALARAAATALSADAAGHTCSAVPEGW